MTTFLYLTDSISWIAQNGFWYENLDWAGLAALLLAAYTIYKGIKTQPAEREISAANVATQFAEAADKATARAEKAIARCDDLEIEIRSVKRTNEIVSKNYRIVVNIAYNWARGIDKLQHQLEGLKLTPVWNPLIEDVNFVRRLIEDTQQNKDNQDELEA